MIRSGAEHAVVVGAGVGGLCAAARLAAAGWRVSVLEKHHQVGGRWSTREVEGFLLPTGAFLIAMDDPLAETFAELGIDFPVRAIEERTVFRVAGRIVGTGETGGLRALIGAATAEDGSDAAALLDAVRRGVRDGAGDDGGTPLPEWLRARGAGETVVAAIHALVQAFMALNAAEVSASAFFDYLRLTAGHGRHGIPPGGSRQLAENLAGFVTGRGGTVRTGTQVTAMTTGASGAASGVLLADGSSLEADLVVSDVGIRATAGLLPERCRSALESVPAASVVPAPGVTCFVASPEPFYEHPAVVVTGTRRACLVSTPTLVAPELAPEGWHVTEVISTFGDSTMPDAAAEERRLLRADVDELLPCWRETGRQLLTMVYRNDWPVYRAWPGSDSQERFPLPGLALVGDSVKPPGWPGTGASAESARLAVAGIGEGRHLQPTAPTGSSL